LLVTALAAAPSAGAVQKVRAAVEIGHAEKSGKNATFTIDVTFPVPAGLTAATACKGKVSASYKLSKKKTLKWSGSFKPNDIACLAEIKGKLPADKYGKKLKFGIDFKGSKSIKPFSVSKSLKIVAPPGPPVAPAPVTPPANTGPPVAFNPIFAYGNWATDPPTTGYSSVFQFAFASDYSMGSFQQSGSSFRWNCTNVNYPTPQLTSALVFFDTTFVVTNGTVDGSHHYSLSNGVTNDRDVDYTLHIGFDQHLTGHGTFTANGTWTYAVENSPGSGTYHDELFSCSRTVAFDAYHYGATGL
jgi:hypothetical protein